MPAWARSRFGVFPRSSVAQRALVAGMRRFAGDADIQLIAEGIETKPQLDTLRQLDIELGQGFLLGRPQPAGGVADPGAGRSRNGRNGV